MAVTFACGFEAQQAATDNWAAGGSVAPAYSTAQHQTGAASIRVNPGSGIQSYVQIGNPSGGWVHFGLYVATRPSVTRTILNSPPAANNVALRMDSTGAIECWVANVKVGTTTALSTGTWYWIGIRNNTGTGVEWMQVDGVNQGFTATATISSGISSIGCFSNEASAIDLYYDDIVLDDAGFLAPSKVDLALPISDNTVTGVTDGGGTTSNLWSNIDQTPPTGVASANESTGGSNIRFPASLTEVYIANLETYTTLGVGSAAEIIGAAGVIRHGEDIATGTKNGTFTGLVANPNSSYNTAFVFGNDGGAHGAETGLWVTLAGGFLGPAVMSGVTVGTSPQLRVQRASESRVGCVDFMGLLVVWTPAAAATANPPIFSTYPQLLAQ